MKEMIYQKDGEVRKREVLDTGFIFGYLYYILSLGTHPTAYIKIPTDHPYFKYTYYDEIPLNVHGGLTYMTDEGLIIGYNDFIEGKFIGWDYAHAGDYYSYLGGTTDKKWTTKEIQEEVRDACYQLEQAKNRGEE